MSDRTREDTVLGRLRGALIVSYQAYPGEPMRAPDTMRRVAPAARDGGAAGILAQGLDDLRPIRGALDLPLTGLWKDGTEGVCVTPTARHALAVLRTGADAVALDATGRPRADGRPLSEPIDAVRAAGGLVTADVSTYEEGVRSARPLRPREDADAPVRAGTA